MNRNKKTGIAIFLFLIGSLEAGRSNRLTNKEGHAIVASRPSIAKNHTQKKHKIVKVKKVKASPKKQAPKKHKATKVKKHKVPNPPKKSSSKKKVQRKAKYDQKAAKRKEDRKEAKSRQVYLGEGRFKSYKQEFAYGAAYYHKNKKVEFLDALQTIDPNNAIGLISAATEKDEIEITKSKPAIQVSYVLSAVYENMPALFKAGETVEASFGLQASFAKKDDAYQGTYKDAGVAGDLRTRQDIKKYTVQVFGQYELFRCCGWKYNFKLASGLSVGALRDLRLYVAPSEGNLFYIGQRLEVEDNKSRPTVEFGLNVTKEAGPLELVFGSDIGYVRQTYKNYLTVEQADTRAPQVHHTNFVNLRANSARHLLTIVPPVFKLWSFNFKMGAAFSF